MTVHQISSGHGFLEAPRWRDGTLYVSDFFAHKVLAFDESGNSSTICEVPGRPSGLGWTPDGELLVVSMLDRKLLRQQSDGELVEVADLSHIAPWYTNDMAVDHTGRSYIGNFGWDDTARDEIEPTVLIRVDPDGSVAVAADDLVFPNGIVFSPDRETLIVAETFAGRISAFDVAADGTLSNRRVWADLTDGRTITTISEALDSGFCLPDGIALANDGTLWIADAARSGAVRVAEGGEVLETVSLGSQTAFAVALGGKSMNRLFLCAGAPYRQGDPSADWQSRLMWTEV